MTTHTQTPRPRIAIGGIVHESNSFFSVNTTLADFDRRTGDDPGAALEKWGKNNDEVSGFIEGGARFGLDLYPTLVAHATPSGPVTDEALDALTGDLLRRIRSGGNFEGLLLALHGAMVAQSYLHADGEVMRRLREALGSGFPIVVTHDFHANISSQVVELSTALLNYKTNPHIDQRDRGIRAAWIMSGIVSGKFKPVQALAKPGMIYNIRFQNTNAEPLAPIVEETRRLEEQDGILAASVAGGYQYADVPAMGASVVVVTNNDRELAKHTAKRLSGELWDTRDRLALRLPDPAAAVRQAISSNLFPVVLVEMGDNIGGGASGDATFLLSELVRQKASGWFVALADPRAVEAAAEAGIGGAFDMEVGAKTDRLHGDPVRIRGRVKSLHDGRFMETAVRHGGQRYYDQGLTAVIDVEGSTPDNQNLVMLTARRQMPFSLHQLIAHGIYPERQRILVVKAAVAFRAAYEPVAGSIIEVDTPGVTAVNPRRFTWKHVDPSLFGLEP
ncbi:MAG: M81 family metallopeptidase [Bryobacteraceae bacterium]|nr:M81 family metallopeptidase [Bryobacterales bacterium]MEB2360029.1 M81 family metallopeptidase [Bryobacterales bacterium]NUN03054.1 M81 family metallopeptidase [Bryobacteraceae bacterium]